MAYGRESIELTPVESVAAGDGPVNVPDAALLFASEFQRAGSDLKLVADDGGEFLVTNYFATSAPPSLVAPNNASLDGGTVGLLAGPAYPGQYAQAGPAAKVEAIGKVETLEGAVTAQRADGTTHQLQAGDPIFESDVISTGKASLLGIRLVDGTVLALQESGKLVLNKFVYSANGSDNAALLNILEGTFSLFAGDMAPSGDMKIQTPIATMGIRGTSIIGVNVSTLAGRLSLTQDPDSKVGFIEVFNNLNGDLFTVLRAIFNKVTLTDAGLLALSAKTPGELAFDQNLTQALHDFYENLGPPQAGPEPQGQPLTGSPFFEAPTFQEIDFGNPVDSDTEPETVEIPPELLIQFLASLLQIPRIQELIAETLQESTAPTAGDLDLAGLDEATNVQEGSQVDSSLPFSFGPSGPGTVDFASLDGEPVLDANGAPVTTDGVELVYVWDPENNVLIAVIPGDDGGETPDIPIFSILVDPTTGAITVTIIGAVDHLGVNDLQLSIDLAFTVTAANGQTVTGELTVAVDDAVPTAVSDVAVVPQHVENINSDLPSGLSAALLTGMNVLGGEGDPGEDDFGADGPAGDGIQSIEVDGVTFTFDGDGIVSDEDQNPQQNLELIDGPQFGKTSSQFSEAEFIDIGTRSLTQTDDGTLVVQTDLGGVLTFHFTDGEGHSAGDWEYRPPPTNYDYYDYNEGGGHTDGEGELPLPYENFRYTIVDNDGDTSTASLTIEVDPSKINDVVQGDAGDNVLAGAPGDDVSSGNVLVGNLGADNFVVNGFNVFDYIADYEFGEDDQVDLSAVLDGSSFNLNSDVRLLELGNGAVDALQVHDGESFTTVALLNGDAGVNIIIDDTTATVNPTIFS